MLRLALVLTMVLSAMPAVITLAAILLVHLSLRSQHHGGAQARKTQGKQGAVMIEGRTGKNTASSSQTIIASWFASTTKPTSQSANARLGPARRTAGACLQGQVKKWQIGHQLPTGPFIRKCRHLLSFKLPPPSAGLRYVRIGNDILLISVRTEVVVDAIQDLGRMEAQTSRE